MLLERELSFPPCGHTPVTTQDNWYHQSETIKGHESMRKMKVTDAVTCITESLKKQLFTSAIFH